MIPPSEAREQSTPLHVDDPVALAEEYAYLDADPSARRRMLLSFGIAIVLVSVVLGFVRFMPPQTREPLPPVVVALERPATPPPTPRPTLPPTPAPTPPRISRVTPAPVPQRAASRSAIPKISRGGGMQAAPLPLATPVPAPVVAVAPSAVPAPAAAAPESGTGGGIGAGSGSGAGSGNGTAGGTGGTGLGTVNADVPCGYVEFIPVAPPRYVGGTAYERIRATIHFRDGHRESEVFPYPWVYPDGEQTDPWSQTNLRNNPQAPVPAQLPPPGSNTARFPPLIRYILDHTTPTGHTSLPDCAPPA